MQKKKLSKKMLASILAGALITVAVITAGTFAWFTANAGVDPSGEFTTARVALDAGEGDYGVYEFATGHPFNITMQTIIESYYGKPNVTALLTTWLKGFNPDEQGTPDKLDEAEKEVDRLNGLIVAKEAEVAAAFAQWQAAADRLGIVEGALEYAINQINNLRPVRSDFASGIGGTVEYIIASIAYNVLYDEFLYPAYKAAYDALDPARLDVLDLNGKYNSFVKEKMGFEDLLKIATDYIDTLVVYIPGDPNLVTPGSIIYGKFVLANDSNIDTYFRMSGVGVGYDDVDADLPYVAFAQYEDQSTVPLTLGLDGKLYCPEKLPAYQSITLVIGMYVFGEANVTPSMDQVFGITGDGGIDLIQASNNAAALDNTWKYEVTGIPFTFFK